MNGVALLDVNLLVALFDPDHVHHELAHDWFADNHAHGWATCPLTQNGFVRILAHPRFPAEIRRPAELLEHLTKFCGLARKMGGYLATLDGSILPSAVNGATRETIAVISTAAE